MDDTENDTNVTISLPALPRHIDLLRQARRLLAEARTVSEVKDLRDKAESVRLYLRQREDAREAQQDAAELRVRAERKLGELLAATVNHAGSRGVGRTVRPTLPEGVSKSQSHRWQRLASVPADAFEAHLARCREAGNDITTAGVAALARLQSQPHPEPDPLDDACAIADLHALVATGRKFGTIYADPFWPYGVAVSRGACARHYATMTIDEIAGLPVADLAAEACHLHLWTTSAFLGEALGLMERWGFEYKSQLVWSKAKVQRERDETTGEFTGWLRVRPQWGCGNYWRVSHELLLLGVRGSAPFADKRLLSYHIGPRRKHSAKPDAVRRMIERASPGPYLELFARRAVADHPDRPPWVVWGNEIERDLFTQLQESSHAEAIR
jgi:N6-adenosine-specific RNA methylase IME4